MAYSSLGCRPTVISHNVRGLNIPEKCTTLLRELKKGRSHFVFLQETNIKTHHVPSLTDSFFTKAYHATNNYSKYKRGSILVSKETPFELSEQVIDQKGRFVFLKGTYGGTPLTLANVYFPNTAHLTFCNHIVQELQGFASGCIILRGYFIIPLNRLVDTSSGKTCISYQVFKKLKTLLLLLEFLNPEGRDFSFYSSPHDRYACLEYLFITQRDLPELSGAHIGIQ